MADSTNPATAVADTAVSENVELKQPPPGGQDESILDKKSEASQEID